MSVCYDKLWKMLIDKRMNRTDLKEWLELVLMYWQKWEKEKRFSLEKLA